jgi:hypothetical protein
MNFSAAHVDYVIWAYVLSGLCLVGLCICLLSRDRKLAKKIRIMSEKTKS